MKLVVIKSNFRVLLVPNYRDLRYRYVLEAFSHLMNPKSNTLYKKKLSA